MTLGVVEGTDDPVGGTGDAVTSRAGDGEGSPWLGGVGEPPFLVPGGSASDVDGVPGDDGAVDVVVPVRFVFPAPVFPLFPLVPVFPLSPVPPVEPAVPVPGREADAPGGEAAADPTADGAAP